MIPLETPKIRLRALETSDIDILYKWENDTRVWGVSYTLLPFSRNTLRMFIEAQTQDIYETKQTRFIIESQKSHQPIGAIDLFDFDPLNLRAGVGILIYDPKDRGKGYATDSLEIIIRYAAEVLRLHQLYGNIAAGNMASIALFEKRGFKRCGIKRDWLRMQDGWVDEEVFQIILG